MAVMAPARPVFAPVSLATADLENEPVAQQRLAIRNVLEGALDDLSGQADFDHTCAWVCPKAGTNEV
eukprot:scaffold455_cov45-Prasinocladus_malaysianus.AAC.2